MKKEINEIIKILGKLYTKKDTIKRIWSDKKNLFKNNFLDDKFIDLLADIIVENRVAEIVLKNCSYIKDINLNRFQSLLKNKLCSTYNSVTMEKLNDISKLFNHENIIFIKGSSLCNLYPKEYTRYQVDVDIIVKSIDDIWDLLEKGKEMYRYDRLKIYTGFNSSITASIDMYPIRKDYPYIDVHVYPFEIWGSIVYESDMLNRKIKINNFIVPSYEDMLLILTAHISKQWMYRVRDINDAYILLNNNLDWTYINEIAKKNNLIPFLKILLVKVKEIYDLDLLNNLQNTKGLCFSEKLFKKYNLGKSNVYAATPLEIKFVYTNYRIRSKKGISLYNTLINTKNLIIYKNRAYKVNKKLVIKKFNENTILVLKPTDTFISKNDIYSRNISNSMKIYNEGQANEIFTTPVGNWIQSTYYVK